MAGKKKAKSESLEKTKHARINGDLAEDLSWILQVLGPEATSAKLLDPYIRGPIKALRKKHEPAIIALQKAQQQARKSAEE